MTRNAADILKAALALPSEARAALAASLLHSLDARVEVRHRLFVRARHRALNRLSEGLDLQWAPAARDDVHRR